uniref:Exportin 5 [Megachile rotundata] n=1 Tax=Lepeophtheirus salmonis TaxID=72036 RepID=A0A0K2UPE2_LEPSM
MSHEDVSSACLALAQAAELVTDPKTSREDRLRAYQECESFKDRSPIAAECGFALASDTSKSLVVRICGLKILEDSIKSRWNDFNPQVKLSLKENLMNMIRSSMGDVLSEPIHIKDGISRCIVEIIKREWPQHWPTLLAELNGCCVSEIGTEISLFVILRLVEDIAVLQNLEQTQRRKEIYTALTQQLGDIFAFLMSLLERHYKAYLESTEILARKRQVKVCSAALGTFNAFVEWVPVSYVMANDKYLIRCLCHLLMDESLQLNAGECLLNIVSIKCVKNQDRLQFLSFFETDMITQLFSATEAAEQKSSSDDVHYVFLKKMVLILVELGNQLCGLWSIIEKHTQRPSNFDVYLNAILFFTRHPSLTVNFYVNELWIKFFRHTEILKDDIFKDFVPKWAEIVLKKTVKLGYRNEGFSILDFETEEEYGTFFGKYRIIILEGVKLVCCNYSPTLVYDHIEEWLSSLLRSQILNESLYLQIEAVSLILDPVLSKSNLSPILARALHLLKSILEYETSDPILSSNLLSCVSASFVLVAHDSTLLPIIMNKIFSCITFTERGTSNGHQISQVVKTLRRHGCSLLVKIATKFASTLHPIFDHLKDTIATLRETDKINKMEFSCLVEALVLVSNEFKNYSIQANFVENVSAFPFEEFKSLQENLSSAETFVEYIGLTKVNDVKVDKLAQDPYYVNRSKISFCTTFLLSVCRRTKVPSDINECHSGGFILHEEPCGSGSFNVRNPAASVANAALPLFLSLARVINSLWTPENISKYGYSRTLEMIDTEKLTVTGSTNVDSSTGLKEKKTSSRDKMKSFIYETYENIFHFLYECCSSFGSEFYRLPGLTEALKSYLFAGIHNVPDYRLRCLVKTFMKSFINKCSKSSFSDVLGPILLDFCPYMLTRLTERWKYIESIVISDDDAVNDNEKDSKEVLEDVFLRQLTRDYLNAVKVLFMSGNGNDVVVNPTTEDQSALSELGKLVLDYDTLRECLLVTLLRALVWNDSLSSVRACNLIKVILPYVILSKKLNEDGARQIMISILSAFHALGQHEMNNIALTQLAIQAYEWMRSGYPSVLSVLSQVPGCNQEDLKRFDDRIVVAINGKDVGKVSDRVKKDMFKKIINQFVGKDKAQLFKKEVIIKNLPSFIPPKIRHKNLSLDETETNDISLTTLFNNGTK